MDAIELTVRKDEKKKKSNLAKIFGNTLTLIIEKPKFPFIIIKHKKKNHNNLIY
jgi:hypothetical protein